MALTKLPKNAITDGSIDSDKIEDGTIQAVELSGTLSEEKLATGTIENAKLSNSTITINGTSVSLGGSSSVGVDVNWQSVITADGSTTTTGVAGNGYFIDTTSAAHTFTLPASATLGDQIAIKDYAGTFASNNLTIDRNGHNIQGITNNSLINTNKASLLLVYVDSTKGWIYAEESNVGDLGKAIFTSATGGTITESGDYKIHTFTGDGCFVVSTAGNGAIIPTGGPAVVDYLVVAGGGGSSLGGGGAGGYREGKSGCAGCYTASPLAASCGITVTSTTYPITVGGGGAGQPGQSSGSPSIFSTITSAGGGKGNWYFCAGTPGGSGGGGAYAGPLAGGSGNTPPVSPPQGNNGGNGSPAASPANAGGAAGGGGAGAVGQNGANNDPGNGGAGVTSSFNGTPTTRAGGGGAGGFSAPGGTGGPGGGGPGGLGPDCSGGAQAGTPGTANTGGGGGGSGRDGVGGMNCGGAGGKGIVIIRYKFQ